MKLILIIFQSKLKCQKATSHYSYRAPGKRRRQNLHLLFISPGDCEGTGGPPCPPFVQLSGPGCLPCWLSDVMPGCDSGTFSVQRMDYRGSTLLFIFFSGTESLSTLWPDRERPEAALWMLGGLWCSPAQRAGLLGWNARPTQRLGQGGLWEGARALPWLHLVCSGHRRERSCFHGSPRPLPLWRSVERL